jgi:hypothetical protein
MLCPHHSVMVPSHHIVLAGQCAQSARPQGCAALRLPRKDLLGQDRRKASNSVPELFRTAIPEGEDPMPHLSTLQSSHAQLNSGGENLSDKIYTHTDEPGNRFESSSTAISQQPRHLALRRDHQSVARVLRYHLALHSPFYLQRSALQKFWEQQLSPNHQFDASTMSLTVQGRF